MSQFHIPGPQSMSRAELPHCHGCGATNASGLNHCTPFTMSCEPDCFPAYKGAPATTFARLVHQPTMPVPVCEKLTENGVPVPYVETPETCHPPRMASTMPGAFARNWRLRPTGSW